jgi:hypothetical protein
MLACYNSEFLPGTVNPINPRLGSTRLKTSTQSGILRTLKGHKHTSITLVELEHTMQDIDSS